MRTVYNSLIIVRKTKKKKMYEFGRALGMVCG
jgi:hypothetical protein